MKALLAALAALPAARQRLYLDFEGVNLCRHGELCIGQLAFPGGAHVYVLDFVILPGLLDVADSAGSSLRTLLEDRAWKKFFFDPRNDVDALYHQFGGVLPVNVICLQLSDVARDRSRGASRPHVNGLARVLEAQLPVAVRAATASIKEAGKRLFAPERGGSYQVFKQRPLSQAIVDYCVADVAHFELLERRLFEDLDERYSSWVVARSTERAAMCLRASYWGNGRQNAVAPSGP